MNFTKLGWGIVRQRSPFWFPSGPGPSAEYWYSEQLKDSRAFLGPVLFASLISPGGIGAP